MTFSGNVDHGHNEQNINFFLLGVLDDCLNPGMFKQIFYHYTH